MAGQGGEEPPRRRPGRPPGSGRRSEPAEGPRAERVQVYLDPNVRSERDVLRALNAAREEIRGQDFLRGLLWAGLQALGRTGNLPKSVLDEMPELRP